MANVLSISSQVVYGHVGNSTSTFVLQRMGHRVLSVPTVFLSNRPGYAFLAGQRADPSLMQSILEAIEANGWLADIDAVVTGYLPSAEHAQLCARWVSAIKATRRDVLFLCDPILGDEPGGLYIDPGAAKAVKDALLPLADVVTPNAFELAWLSGRVLDSLGDTIAAARALPTPTVIVTSAPAGNVDTLANLLVEPETLAATLSPRRNVRAHGTGDFFAAIFLARLLSGLSAPDATRAAAAAVEFVIERSDGHPELPLIETQSYWAAPDAPLAPQASLSSGLDVSP